MNENNLIPFTSEQSREQAKRNGQKGGIASGKARRDKARLKRAAEQLINMPITDEETRNKLLAMGFEENELTYAVSLVFGLFNAVTEKYNVEAFREIKKLIGEEETANNDTLDKLDEVLNKISGNI